MLRTLKHAPELPLPILPPDVRPHRLGVVVNAQRVCRRVVDDVGLFAVVPVSQGKAQTSASWLSGGSFQRQSTPQLPKSMSSTTARAPASLGQSAAWAALAGNTGL